MFSREGAFKCAWFWLDVFPYCHSRIFCSWFLTEKWFLQYSVFPQEKSWLCQNNVVSLWENKRESNMFWTVQVNLNVLLQDGLSLLIRSLSWLGPSFLPVIWGPWWITFSIKNNRDPSSCGMVIHQRCPKPTFQNPNILELSMFYFSSQLENKSKNMGQCRTDSLIFSRLCFERTRKRISKFLCFGKSYFNQKWKGKTSKRQQHVSPINVIFNATYFSWVFSISLCLCIIN